MNDKERIEKQAERWVNTHEDGGYEIGPADCYIAGAQAEHERMASALKELIPIALNELETCENDEGALSEIYETTKATIDKARKLIEP